MRGCSCASAARLPKTDAFLLLVLLVLLVLWCKIKHCLSLRLLLPWPTAAIPVENPDCSCKLTSAAVGQARTIAHMAELFATITPAAIDAGDLSHVEVGRGLQLQSDGNPTAIRRQFCSNPTAILQRF